MGKYSLRKASVVDAPAIVELFLASQREALPYLPELHSDEETLDYFGQDVLRNSTVWVCTAGPAILGFVALKDGWVQHLYCHPHSQGIGVGSLLLRTVMEANPAGLSLYAFERNTRARQFYERRGFIAVEFGDGSGNEEGLPDVLYRWLPDSPIEE